MMYEAHLQVQQWEFMPNRFLKLALIPLSVAGTLVLCEAAYKCELYTL